MVGEGPTAFLDSYHRNVYSFQAFACYHALTSRHISFCFLRQLRRGSLNEEVFAEWNWEGYHLNKINLAFFTNHRLPHFEVHSSFSIEKTCDSRGKSMQWIRNSVCFKSKSDEPKVSCDLPGASWKCHACFFYCDNMGGIPKKCGCLNQKKKPWMASMAHDNVWSRCSLMYTLQENWSRIRVLPFAFGVDVWPVVTSFTIDGSEHKYWHYQ